MPTYTYTPLTFSNSTSSDTVWGNWVGTGTVYTTATSISNEVWTAWNNDTITPVRQSTNGAIHTTVSLTPAQIEAFRAAEQARHAEWLAREEVRKAEEAEARRKARILLEENLTDEQRKQFADNAWFEVVTPRGTYRIRTGWSGNVDRYVDGRATDRYCIHPSEWVPNEDNMLAQKLLLEADEEAFLRIANRSTPYA